MKLFFSMLFMAGAFFIISAHTTENASQLSEAEIAPLKTNGDGWHVRICATETTANVLKFSAGAANDSNDKTKNFKWRQGRDNVVEIPKDYRYKTDLYLEVSLGNNERATICLLYDNRVVKTFNVTQEIKITINNAETDSCPC